MNNEQFKEEIIQNKLIKYFKHHIEFIEKLRTWQKYHAKSDIPTLNNVEVELMKGKGSFHYRCKGLATTKEAPVNYQNKGYGFCVPFSLSNEGSGFVLPDGVNTMNMSLGNSEYEFIGNINRLYTQDLKSGHKYFRSITSIQNNSSENITNFFKTLGFKVDQWFKFGGLIRTEKVDLFEYNFKKKQYLIIETRVEMGFNEFEKECRNIKYCFGFITGHLNRGETFIFSSVKLDFTSIDEFSYEIARKTVNSYATVIPYRLISSLKKSSQLGDTRLKMDDFESIINKSLTHPELYRCVRLLTEAGDLPLELKTSIYSVCIETMRNLIIDTKGKKIKPFKEKGKADDFIAAAKIILNNIPDSEFNSKESIVKGLDNINQIGNTDSFIKIFELLKIELSEDDIKTLKMRNEFLHGKIDLEPAHETTEQIYISDKLYQLVSYLILKYCGFTGYVLHHANLNLLLGNEKIKHDKYIIRMI